MDEAKELLIETLAEDSLSPGISSKGLPPRLWQVRCNPGNP